LLKDGYRFCNELGTRAYVTDKMLQSNALYSATGKWDRVSEVPTFHLVLASSAATDAKRHVDLYSHKGLLRKVKGLDALAEYMGIEKTTLKSTMKNYQKAAKKGIDEFGKVTFRGVPNESLAEEVFYVGVVTPVLHYCMGGIKINTEGCVLKEDGSIIPGLLAAGEVTGGVHGSNRLAGNSLLECTVFGTIVGQKVPIKEKTSRNSIATPKVEKDVMAEDQVITMSELAKHNTEDNLWVALHGIVYDFTEFAHEHPAGFQSIFDLAGADGTEAFDAVHNIGMLDDFDEDRKGILTSA